MLTKICTTCGVEKGANEYHRFKLGKYGIGSQCKSCRKQYKLQHYQANKKEGGKKILAYVKANPHIKNSNNAKRKAAKLQAIPAWANLEAIKGMYLIAAINREGGYDLHVDHIVPLISDIVCGLHCEANLQLMPASDNISKGNRHWPDMP
jgi:hypothetical protein